MPDAERQYHISSAIVAVAPSRVSDVLAGLQTLAGVGVHAVDAGRIVITIEGWSTGELGDCLTTISLMDGVLAANMVFEHAEKEAIEP
jgi:periplasmic nitrate reductase NapD